MSSDIPGFYYDSVQRRYYRLESETANATPSARRISERARQEELVNKQLTLIHHRRKQVSRSMKTKENGCRSRLSLITQRRYGRVSSGFFHRTIRRSFIESLNVNCFLDDTSSFTLSNQIIPETNYELRLTQRGQCIQIVDFQLYLTNLSNLDVSYRLPGNSVDGHRSSYFMESSPFLMSTTLLHDEVHVIVRFLEFSPVPKKDFSTMISNRPSSAPYFVGEKQKTLTLSSNMLSQSSSLMIKCAGPCCYSLAFDHFALNIDNHLNIYDTKTFEMISSLRVPIRRVTLSDVKFSNENSNLIFTTNGHQCQQWDIRQSNRACALRLPIACSKLKCLQTKSNCILTSSFDERINLIDLRWFTRPLLIYDLSTSTSNNPHFDFSIDYGTEDFVAACSHFHLASVWDLNSGELLNRFRSFIPERSTRTPSQCAIASINRIPILGIYRLESTRFSRPIDKI